MNRRKRKTIKVEIKIPRDWIRPMKDCAKRLEEFGIKTKWDSPLIKTIMLWGFQAFLFHEIYYKKRRKTYQKKNQLPVGFLLSK